MLVRDLRLLLPRLEPRSSVFLVFWSSRTWREQDSFCMKRALREGRQWASRRIQLISMNHNSKIRPSPNHPPLINKSRYCLAQSSHVKDALILIPEEGIFHKQSMVSLRLSSGQKSPKNGILLFNNLFIIINMVESKAKSTVTRAKLAHKLARYFRATPVHLTGTRGDANPSTSHLQLGGAPKRRLRNKANTWYPADDEKAFIKRASSQPKPSAGRKSITPGTVVILLSGPSRGRRVVALKSLKSGNLLVTGPYAVNGVPLRRVNPAYVLSTSTKVSLDGVNANVDDAFFKSHSRYTKNELKNASDIRLKKVAEDKEGENKWRAELKNVQKAVDAKLVENIKKVENLKGYLGTRFTISNGTRPHALKF